MRTTILFLFLLLFLACGSPAPDTPPNASEPPVAAPPAVPEITDVNPDNDPRPLDDLIRVTAPKPNTEVASPLEITGEARGLWFFEGDFPIALYTESGEIIGEGFGHSPEPWMTEEFIPFSAELSFAVPSGTRLRLELMLNNPADDEGFDRSIIIPLIAR